MKNLYSREWFELFLQTRPYTQEEAAFIERNLPNPPYRRVLDLCCGEGRHTNILAEKGYEMVGVDLDAEALAIAARNSRGGTVYLEKDMRALYEVPGQFDAVLSLWQSFGYFDEATNRDILRQIGEKLVPGGRLILELYHRAYWVKNQGVRELERKRVKIRAENRLTGNRLRSSLIYGAELGADIFEWQLYSPEEIQALAQDYGLEMVLSCTECDEGKAVTPQKPMMQFVFEKGK